MIEVVITHVGSEVELGRITIENVDTNLDGTANYSIRFGVDRQDAVGIHQRGIFGFPREKFNVFALLLQALNTLEPDELKLDGDLSSQPPLRKELGSRRRKWRSW